MAQRTRSEYRLTLAGAALATNEATLEPVAEVACDELARLLLDAYRGTIDDEGETFDDALDAAGQMLADAVPAWSNVLRLDDGSLGAACIVTALDDIHWINPIIVTPTIKRQGAGRSLVAASLLRMRADGEREAGAAITDGNVASERLFTSLGFRRVGPWPPARFHE